MVPKKHYERVWDVENIGEYFEVCKKIAKHFQKVTNDDLVFTMIVGEEVPHAHIRLFPGNNQEFNEKFYGFLEETKAGKPLDDEQGEEIRKEFELS